MPLTFPKSERISSPLEVALLAKTGKWEVASVLKACYKPVEEGTGRMAVAVPKKLFKRAVKRNLLKRRIREAYRHLKGENPSVDMLLIYTSNEIASYSVIFENVETLIQKIGKR